MTGKRLSMRFLGYSLEVLLILAFITVAAHHISLARRLDEERNLANQYRQLYGECFAEVVLCQRRGECLVLQAEE